MELEELFCALSIGELSNLAMANDGDGTIADDKKMSIVAYANAGLKRLYGRFLLIEKAILLQQQRGVTHYHLKVGFSQETHDPSKIDVPYILDTEVEPFRGDVARILSVWDNDGCRLPLNDDNLTESLFTPQPTILQIPRIRGTDMVCVNYQAYHPTLCLESEGVTNDAGNLIQLPECLIEALTAFIAYKVYTHMNTQDSTAKAAEHLGNYEQICQQAVDRDMVSETVAVTSSKFNQRGFV